VSIGAHMDVVRPLPTGRLVVVEASGRTAGIEGRPGLPRLFDPTRLLEAMTRIAL
jgi:hypothetical protein